MDFERAWGLAMRLSDALAPACERVEVAGSIRRRKPQVKDIEIVAIPRWSERPATNVQAALGEPQPMEPVNHLQLRVQQLADEGHLEVIKPGTPGEVRERWHLKADGKYWRLHVPRRDINVDLFLCTPETWGLVYLIRTGSADFSQAVLARWKAITGGGHSVDARLYRPGHREPQVLPDEEDVFRACRMQYVPPPERVDADAARRAAALFDRSPEGVTAR